MSEFGVLLKGLSVSLARFLGFRWTDAERHFVSVI